MTDRDAAMSDQTRIKADAAYWTEFGSALGWALHGFTFREHASFVTPHSDSLASINGAERDDIMRAIAPAPPASADLRAALELLDQIQDWAGDISRVEDEEAWTKRWAELLEKARILSDPRRAALSSTPAPSPEIDVPRLAKALEKHASTNAVDGLHEMDSCHPECAPSLAAAYREQAD